MNESLWIYAASCVAFALAWLWAFEDAKKYFTPATWYFTAILTSLGWPYFLLVLIFRKLLQWLALAD